MTEMLLVSFCGWLWLVCMAVCVCRCAILEGCVTASLGDPVSVCDCGILYGPPPRGGGGSVCVWVHLWSFGYCVCVTGSEVPR